MRDFKKYDIWNNAHLLTINVYEITKKFPSTEKYSLISQMQKASYSIPSNFAEGCGRDSDKDFNRFIQMSLGSAHELEYFSILSQDLGFISSEEATSLLLQINIIKK
ncbi:four helix bundle protein [Sphingobacterium hungaricum]